MRRSVIALALVVSPSACGVAGDVSAPADTFHDASHDSGLDDQDMGHDDGDADAAPLADEAPPGDGDGDGGSRGEQSTCKSEYQFCDDFEDGLDAARWVVVTTGGAQVAASATAGFAGTRGAELKLPTADGARAFIQPQGVMPAAGNRIFGRFRFLATPTVSWMHTALLRLTGSLGGRAYYGLDANSGRLNSRYDSPAITEHGGLKKNGSYYITSDRWVCVELLIDGEAQEMRYWFDGVEDVAMRVTKVTDPEWVAPTFVTLDLGFQTYQATSLPLTVRLDDVAFDDERIGCPL